MPRQRQTKYEWENTVAAQQVSGLKASKYCAKHNIHIQTFYARRSEINKKAVQTTSKLCSGQLQPDTFLKEFSNSIGD
ncbi:MAG: hypothetical protein ACI9UT_000535 [Flavobacteriales bacterium]|jgi:hypothetical protein